MYCQRRKSAILRATPHCCTSNKARFLTEYILMLGKSQIPLPQQNVSAAPVGGLALPPRAPAVILDPTIYDHIWNICFLSNLLTSTRLQTVVFPTRCVRGSGTVPVMSSQFIQCCVKVGRGQINYLKPKEGSLKI